MTTLAPLQQLQWLAISVLLAGSVFWGCSSGYSRLSAWTSSTTVLCKYPDLQTVAVEGYVAGRVTDSRTFVVLIESTQGDTIS